MRKQYTPKPKYRAERFWLDQPSGVCYHDNAPENVQFRSENGDYFSVRSSSVTVPLLFDPEPFPFLWLTPAASAFPLKRK